MRPADEEAGAHEHVEKTYLYHVRVPYHTDPREMSLEVTVEQDVPSLFMELAEYRDDELRRIFASTAILLEHFPHRTFEACLQTAMVWERG